MCLLTLGPCVFSLSLSLCVCVCVCMCACRLDILQVGRFTNSRTRSRAKSAVADALADAHKRIYDAVKDPKNEYGEDGVAAIGLRAPENIRVILAGQL
mmetsp:Transcript_12581/g.38487  ORF Transcript_12581/g.38487 Transcript_12581/m.38487 type:complete len:98 (-) Transcript_12581:2828-3121(-)